MHFRHLAVPVRIFAAFAVLALAAGCGEGDSQVESKPAMTVTTVTAQQQPIDRTVTASGTVVAWEEMPVGAEIGGLAITDVLVDEGDTVKKGDVLARLNDDVLQAQLVQQKASVEAARATLEEAQANLRRGEELLLKGHLSGQAADSRRANAKTAAAQLQQAEAARAETAARLNQTRITAPDDGYVSGRSAVIGQIVSSGTELFRIVRDSRLELDAEIPESILPRVQAGQTVSVSAQGVPPVEATIRLVSPSVDPQSRLGTAHVALPPESGFRPGMFAQADITLQAVRSTVVPQAAVVYRDGKAGVFVMQQDSTVRFQPVETGERSEELVEVIDGLPSGARIVFKGAGFLEDGDLVTVASAGGETLPGGES
jgi:RND family efflux transporter MFP subunit